LGFGGLSSLVALLLNHWGLDAQQGMFILCMKNNPKVAMEPPFDLNPLTQIWKRINASRVFMHSFLKYLKLAEMAIVHILGSVEDERCFSSLAFLKNKLRATSNPHLPFVVSTYSQKFFTLKSFLFVASFDAWIGAIDRYGILV